MVHPKDTNDIDLVLSHYGPSQHHRAKSPRGHIQEVANGIQLCSPPLKITTARDTAIPSQVPL